jgi:aryl-alcohol dehydrogenase-like predicted oxidoreductase
MRTVFFAPLGQSVSVIGLGCASLGSRVSPRSGIAALNRAYEAGISWYDVAPSYGDGKAEPILGSFLAGKRNAVKICTKVGILPTSPSLPMRMVRPLVRKAVALMPTLRTRVGKRQAATSVSLTSKLIETSIVDSLRRLRTDYVDVLALHSPKLEEMQRDDVLRTLESAIIKGYARVISVAGDLETGLAGIKLSPFINIIQVANNCFTPNVATAEARIPINRPIGFVTHSVYGYKAAYDHLVALLSQDSTKFDLTVAAGYRGSVSDIARTLLIDYGLATNPSGVLLISMYKPEHLSFNLSRLTAGSNSKAVLSLVDRLAIARS